MRLYAATIFLGAFLLFQVQPLIGKYILPWFGGGPGVWTTCMLFFQLLLLAGYGYAHFVGSGFKPLWQARVHGVVLVLSLLTLPIIPSDSWKPPGDAEPTLRILLLLAASVGLPYFVLSTTGPLLQRWFSLSHPGASPYRLYALSNVGSLLALISYPFLFEPALSRRAQAWTWSAGMMLFAVLCGLCAWRLRNTPAEQPVQSSPAEEGGEARPPTIADRTFWLLLPAGASLLLLATTNKMCQDVAVVPFLWVLPLSLYLLSFIISFDSPRWYSRRWFGAAFIVALIGITAAIKAANDIPLVWQVVIYSFGLFVLCMCAHGELYRLRPHPRHLTSFYLMIAAGGATGGLLVAVVAPLVLDDYYEFEIGLVASGLLFIAAVWGGEESGATREDKSAPALPGRLRQWHPAVFGITLGALAGAVGVAALFGLDFNWIEKARGPVFDGISTLTGNRLAAEDVLHFALIVGGALFVIAVWLTRYLTPAPVWVYGGLAAVFVTVIVNGVVLAHEAREDRERAITLARNFYGTLKVLEYNPGQDIDNYYILQHGRITHGMQLRHPTYRNWPTTYYGERSGIGLAVKKFPRQDGQRVAVVGLGTGSMAVYGKTNDYYRFYEINPAVTNIALTHFSHITDCRERGATVDIAMGDARLSLEREPPQQFDIIVLDAFSSDAIPVHLLTRESFALYRRHLKPDGVIVVHISNRHLDLEPVVLSAAKQLAWQTAIVENSDGDIGAENDEGLEAWWIYTSIWVLVSPNKALIEHPDIVASTTAPKERQGPIRLWTDDYTALSQVLERDFLPGWSLFTKLFATADSGE